MSSLQGIVQSKASVAVETIFKCTAMICTLQRLWEMGSDNNNELVAHTSDS